MPYNNRPKKAKTKLYKIMKELKEMLLEQKKLRLPRQDYLERLIPTEDHELFLESSKKAAKADTSIPPIKNENK